MNLHDNARAAAERAKFRRELWEAIAGALGIAFLVAFLLCCNFLEAIADFLAKWH